MIDTDKMRAAYAATPLCQNAWTQKNGDKPTMLCAISAMVSYAGVQPDLIHTMVTALGVGVWFAKFASPVLEAEYRMPPSVAECVPGVFDNEDNEWRGVQAVLDLCEQHNAGELYQEALDEDATRFPQYGPATSDHQPGRMLTLSGLDVWCKKMWLYQSVGLDWLATPTKPAKKQQAAEALAEATGLLVAPPTDLLTVGERAMDEYWKLSGTAPPLWTANIMPEIAKRFAPMTFSITL